MFEEFVQFVILRYTTWRNAPLSAFSENSRCCTLDLPSGQEFARSLQYIVRANFVTQREI